MEKIKLLIIGSGPAGYTAAIYAARANLSPVLYEGIQPGGQLTTTNDVENFPGYINGISGPKMMQELKKQAERFSADIRSGIVTEVDFSNKQFIITIDGSKKIEALAVIISTGAEAKYLGLDSEEKFKGAGVSACATCDGFFYKNMNVSVVGGGDTACEEALYLSGICKKVYLIVRKNYLRASEIMQQRVAENPKIEILFEHTTKEIIGNNAVEGVILTKKDNTEVEIKIDGFFLGIGHKPNTDIFTDYITTDENGYINTKGKGSHTNVEGIFAAGDVQDSKYRQAITAAGSGCKAAIDAEIYLSEL